MNSEVPVAKPSKILLVDDNLIIQQTLHWALRELGYEVLICGELMAALAMARNEVPDLILLDIHFPPDPSVFSGGLPDGLAALALMRLQVRLRGVPIIIISNDEPVSAKPRAMAAGAAAYLHKPIDKGVLAQTVAELLKKNLRSGSR